LEAVLLQPRNLKYLYACWLLTCNVWMLSMKSIHATNVLMTM